MADYKIKRRRRTLQIPAFSTFGRYLSNSNNRVSRSHNPPIGSEPERKPELEPKSKSKSKSKRVEASPSSFSDYDDDEEEEAFTDMIQADFGFFDPKPADFGGVKLLLQDYLDDRIWDLSGFVDCILEQTTVGTVIKLDGDDKEEKCNDDKDNGEEDVYGVISVLNLGRYAGHRCIGELKMFLLESCSDESTKKKLKPMLEEQARDVGLLLSQRFVNCPYQLVPPLYDALFDEVSWATEDEPTQELRDSFRFKFYLLVTRIYENKNATKHKVAAKRDCDEPIIYLKAEDEIFHELSSLSFTFGLHAERLAARELKNYQAMGLVMVVKADEVAQFRTKIKSLVSDS